MALATFADAAAGAELVLNATAGTASIPALEAAGRDRLAGKVLLDIANPLDFSQGFPPTLFVKDTESLAEQIQAAFPEVKVVKSLNTMNAHPHGRPASARRRRPLGLRLRRRRRREEDRDGVAGSFGHTDIVDLGDLSTARGTEMLLPVWVRLYGALGTPMFQFKIVR